MDRAAVIAARAFACHTLEEARDVDPAAAVLGGGAPHIGADASGIRSVAEGAGGARASAFAALERVVVVKARVQVCAVPQCPTLWWCKMQCSRGCGHGEGACTGVFHSSLYSVSVLSPMNVLVLHDAMPSPALYPTVLHSYVLYFCTVLYCTALYWISDALPGTLCNLSYTVLPTLVHASRTCTACHVLLLCRQGEPSRRRVNWRRLRCRCGTIERVGRRVVCNRGRAL